jgi:hypothetical protein
MSDKTTVPDRIRALGLEQGTPAGKELAWRAGAAVRDAWRKVTGEYPPKGNRPKTSGHGSHCFALYPVAWVERIDRIVLEVADMVQADRDRQPDMFR